MKPSITIDTKALDAAFREYAAVSRRGIAENINQKSYSIVNAAYGLTYAADKNEIKELFQPTGKRVIGHKVKFVKKRLTKKEAAGGTT